MSSSIPSVLQGHLPPSTRTARRLNSASVVVIGGSAGSIMALQTILENLSKDFQIPIVVVQHLAAGARIEPAMVYGRYTHLQPVEVIDKMNVEAGHLYFAAPSYHLLLEKDMSLSLSQDELVYFSRPSIDVFFRSLSTSQWAANAAAVLLTGANADGGEALCDLHDRGALTIVQDPASAEASVMPNSALRAGYRHEVLSLADIGKRLSTLTYEAHP